MNSKDKLTNLTKIVSWMDHVTQESPEELEEPQEFKGLSKRQQTLVHWIIYTNDYKRNVEQLWNSGKTILPEIVKKYCEESIEKIFDVIKEVKDTEWSDKGNSVKIRSLVNGNEKFTPTSWAEVYSMLRTLIILKKEKKCNGDLIKFMAYSSGDNVGEFLENMAYRLWLLSYKDIGKAKSGKYGYKKLHILLRDWWNYNKEEEKRILEEVDRYYAGIKEKLDNPNPKEDQEWKYKRFHKRLWASIRDYYIFEHWSILKELDKELKSMNYSFTLADNKNDIMKHLELPGDIWNNRFAEKIFDYNFIEKLLTNKHLNEVKRRDKNELKENISSKLVRYLYEDNHEYFKGYPVQFDATIYFRLCDRKSKRICERICIFGKSSGKEELCNEKEGKLCHVALVTIGKVFECKREGCPIPDLVGKNICKHNY